MDPGFDIGETRTTLFRALLDARDRHGRNRVALEDPERNPLTYGRLVLGALVLGRRLAAVTAEPRSRSCQTDLQADVVRHHGNA